METDGASTGIVVVMGMKIANAKRQSWPAADCTCPGTRRKKVFEQLHDRRENSHGCAGWGRLVIAGNCTRNSQ